MSDSEILADAERRFHEEEPSSYDALCCLAVLLALYFTVVFYFSGLS